MRAIPVPGADDRRAESAAGARGDRAAAARPGARHGNHRLGQVDGARRDDPAHQREPPREHHHDRRSDRVPASRHQLPHQPARGRHRHATASRRRCAACCGRIPTSSSIGEIRDLETLDTALKAADTGHLVFSTLHTTDATQTINRVLSFYPPHQQAEVRFSARDRAAGVISLRLVPRADKAGRVPGRRGPDQHRRGARPDPRHGARRSTSRSDQGRHGRSTACRASTSR